MKKKIWAIGIIALLALGVGLVAAADMGPTVHSTDDHSYVISEEKALEHATVYRLDAVLTHTLGLEEWRGAMVNPEPLTI